MALAKLVLPQSARFEFTHQDGFPDWPDWCYVPAWYVERHIVTEGRASFPLERGFDPMILSVLCAWRMGKGIYRFDPDLLQELWETPVAGEIPGEILLRLPEWGVWSCQTAPLAKTCLFRAALLS